MTWKPMLFSTPMVRAIREGRKTQTRRVVKPQPCNGFSQNFIERNFLPCKCGVPPFGIWVKETWQSVAAMNICHQADDYFVYKADDPDWSEMENWKWASAMFMPRIAARTFLMVESVKLEGLQDISDEDAVAEGFEVGHPAGPLHWYRGLWDSINGKKHPWSENPWVYVYTFKPLTLEQANEEGWTNVIRGGEA